MSLRLQGVIQKRALSCEGCGILCMAFNMCVSQPWCYMCCVLMTAPPTWPKNRARAQIPAGAAHLMNTQANACMHTPAHSCQADAAAAGPGAATAVTLYTLPLYRAHVWSFQFSSCTRFLGLSSATMVPFSCAPTMRCGCRALRRWRTRPTTSTHRRTYHSSMGKGRHGPPGSREGRAGAHSPRTGAGWARCPSGPPGGSCGRPLPGTPAVSAPMPPACPLLHPGCWQTRYQCAASSGTSHTAHAGLT